MISIIVTAYKEEKTINKCLKSITSQKISEPFEVLVIAPDKETLMSAKESYKKARIFKDKGIGKFAALNLGFEQAKGEVMILCDGDTYLGKNSINYMIDAFKNRDVGCASGRVVSINPKNNMLGYWSHLLVEAAHNERLKRSSKKLFIDCSGYLLGLRKGIVKELPPNLLSEDAYISHYVWSKGYDTAYSPKAEVFVKYPTTLSDWIKQKRRSAGGYHQINNYFRQDVKMRSLKNEIIKGPSYALSYAKNPIELVWSLLLFPIRLYLWILTFYDRLVKKSFKQVWQRVETTK
ncbi:Glycosyltransferase AglE [Candidatus Tiddalikarchaeum anstoanum]|nr:Glycosyltransferase AglE [Candidatus Tiddalikarchaeum anstoanum]